MTGIGGFVGGHLAARLAELGADVVGIVRDARSERANIHAPSARVSIVRGCLTEEGLVERALNEYEVEYVFHLAAQAIVNVANRSPASTFESNIRGTWQVLEAARRASLLKGVILASTDKVYGDQAILPYTEDSPLVAAYPYDASKLCADILARSYAATWDLPITLLRCANIYGGGDLNWSRLIPGTIRSVLQGERPLIRSDGTLKRDYLYIDDAVDAYLTLGEQIARDDVRGQAFNFGWSRGHSVLEIVDAILAGAGRTDLPPVILNEAKGEIQHQWLSAEKAARVLQWRPRVPLSEGIERSVAWYASSLGLPAGRGSEPVAVRA